MPTAMHTSLQGRLEIEANGTDDQAESNSQKETTLEPIVSMQN
jgi:hypothetical protein